ncbi:hypothetical protein [Gottfriedia acidiceleris]|uniref:hypothetical protein n=1 Tax=Gottfriedia acidiceleris TaxID=371036 RepID=UPI003D1D2B6B
MGNVIFLALLFLFWVERPDSANNIMKTAIKIIISAIKNTKTENKKFISAIK